jgi:hypothetical protein
VLLEELAKALAESDIPYCIVGGVAVNLHGVPRETYNLDIVVPPQKGALGALAALLAELGFLPEDRVELESLADRKTRRALVRSQNLVALSFVRSGAKLDVVVAPPIDPELLIKRSIACRLGGVRVRVVARADLICMKRVSGRLLDADDAARLERVRG